MTPPKIQFPIRRNILLNPGPATTTDTVKAAMVVPDICPREKEFQDVMKNVSDDLVRIVHGESEFECLMFAGSGTAVMDACVASVVPQGKKIAVICNGAYGERLVQIAQAYEIPVVPIRFDIRVADLAGIRSALKSDSNIASLAMIHHETSTGILNPAKEVGAIAKEFGCSYILDAISTYAGIPLDVKDLKVDFLMSTSNKCIQGMAGIGFVIARRTELEKLRTQKPRAFYLDLYQQFEYQKKTGQMRFTPPVQIIYALKQAIQEYFEEGEGNRYERFTQNWKTLRQGLEKIGFQLLLDSKEESRVLLSVLEPKNELYSFQAVHDALYEKGFTIYPGKIGSAPMFRLANLGDLYPSDIDNFLHSLRLVLEEQGCLPLQYK